MVPFQQTCGKLFLINFLISLGFALCDAFFPLYCKSLGGRGLWLGIAVGSYALVKIFLSPLTGKLSDRYGHAPVLLTGLLLFTLVSMGYGLTDELIVVIGLRILQGAGCAMFRPIIQAQIAIQAPPQHRATFLGRFDSSFYLALCLGSVLGGLIWSRWSFAGLFCALFACCLTALLLAATLPQAIPPRFAAAPGPDDSSVQKPARLFSAVYSGLLLCIFGRAWGIAACATFLPIFLATDLGFSGTQIGVIMAATTVAMALLLRPAGQLADRTANRKLIFSGGLLVALLYLFIPVATEFMPLLLLTSGIGIGSALSQPATAALLTEQGRQEKMGTAVGIFHACMNLGFAAGACASATIHARFGLRAVFHVAAGCVLISLAGLFLPALFTALAKPREKRPQPGPAGKPVPYPS